MLMSVKGILREDNAALVRRQKLHSSIEKMVMRPMMKMMISRCITTCDVDC